MLATTTAYSPSPAAAAAAAESEPAAAGSVPSVEGVQGQQSGDARAAPDHTNAAPRQENTAAVVSTGKNRARGAEQHSAGMARSSGLGFKARAGLALAAMHDQAQHVPRLGPLHLTHDFSHPNPPAQLPESFKKGALFLGSRLAWAANAASAGLSAAKERAESSLTPEARAKLESAKLSTRNNLEKVGSFAKEVASGAGALGGVQGAMGRQAKDGLFVQLWTENLGVGRAEDGWMVRFKCCHNMLVAQLAGSASNADRWKYGMTVPHPLH